MHSKLSKSANFVFIRFWMKRIQHVRIYIISVPHSWMLSTLHSALDNSWKHEPHEPKVTESQSRSLNWSANRCKMSFAIHEVPDVFCEYVCRLLRPSDPWRFAASRRRAGRFASTHLVWLPKRNASVKCNLYGQDVRRSQNPPRSSQCEEAPGQTLMAGFCETFKNQRHVFRMHVWVQENNQRPQEDS